LIGACVGASRTHNITDWISSRERNSDFPGGVSAMIASNGSNQAAITTCFHDPATCCADGDMAALCDTVIVPALDAN